VPTASLRSVRARAATSAAACFAASCLCLPALPASCCLLACGSGFAVCRVRWLSGCLADCRLPRRVFRLAQATCLSERSTTEERAAGGRLLLLLLPLPAWPLCRYCCRLLLHCCRLLLLLPPARLPGYSGLGGRRSPPPPRPESRCCCSCYCCCRYLGEQLLEGEPPALRARQRSATTAACPATWPPGRRLARGRRPARGRPAAWPPGRKGLAGRLAALLLRTTAAPDANGQEPQRGRRRSRGRRRAGERPRAAGPRARAAAA
jgi:hypothetical protein